jgi:sugar phosphate isomerase/epimerase
MSNDEADVKNTEHVRPGGGSHMYLTGFADEASPDIDVQIRATRELGWLNIEARNVSVDGSPPQNLHDIPQERFDEVCRRLECAGIRVNCFGSTIANWGKSVLDPLEITLAEVQRAIPRMQRLGTKLIRIMSYAVLKDRGPQDQEERERFRRLREIVQRFGDAGLTAVHENCMNYGGLGWTFTQRLIENVQGLKLVFDTGNPIASKDYARTPPLPHQSSWEFYERVRDHVIYIHIKDGVIGPDGKIQYTFPGEGAGDVRRIVADLLHRGYDGGISIEPHLKAVFHDPSVQSNEDVRYANYVEYGRRMERLIAALRPA